MGCDIHTYIEFADFETDAGPYWKNFTQNPGGRNYIMFGVLAGVRVERVKLFEPKGMPAGRIGYDTSEDYWLHVAPADHPEWADGDGWVTLETAEQWVEKGYSIGETNKTGRLERVSGPDWHSHSWLTADELDRAFAHYLEQLPKFYPSEKVVVPAEWLAMLAAMRTFEAAGKPTRLIFWFDN